MITYQSLLVQVDEKKKLRDEFTRSIKNPDWFAPRTLVAFRKTRAKLNKDIAALNISIHNHPDNPKNKKQNGKIKNYRTT